MTSGTNQIPIIEDLYFVLDTCADLVHHGSACFCGMCEGHRAYTRFLAGLVISRNDFLAERLIPNCLRHGRKMLGHQRKGIDMIIRPRNALRGDYNG